MMCDQPLEEDCMNFAQWKITNMPSGFVGTYQGSSTNIWGYICKEKNYVFDKDTTSLLYCFFAAHLFSDEC